MELTEIEASKQAKPHILKGTPVDPGFNGSVLLLTMDKKDFNDLQKGEQGLQLPFSGGIILLCHKRDKKKFMEVLNDMDRYI